MKNFIRIVGSRVALLIVNGPMTGGVGSTELYYIIRYLIPRLILIALIVNVRHAWSSAGFPPEEMTCARAYHPSAAWNYTKCEFMPYGKFVPSNAEWSYPGAFMLPADLPHNHSLKLKAHFNGFNADQGKCASWDFAERGYIVTKNCTDYYPNLSKFPGYWTPWGGAFNGELAQGWRISAMFTRAHQLWKDSIDVGAGIMLEGGSEGATTAILQSMLLPDQWWRNQIVIVRADVPPTLIMRTDDPIGNYWRDPKIQFTWGGFDWRKADILNKTKKVKHIYYRINGSPADTGVVFDLDFFRKVCDQKKIACFGTWHNAGHSATEPGINLPFWSLYSGPDMQVRLDTMLPVFTNSTANFWGKRGHYNLGLEWANTSQNFIDSKARAALPIRYLRRTAMGGDIPDQPLTATFDLTIRRPTKFTLPVGQKVNWSIGEQSGQVTVTKAGEVTILQITLNSSPEYAVLSLTK